MVAARSVFGKALDDHDVVIATPETVLACFLVHRALVPRLCLGECRELDDRRALDPGALLHLARAEAGEPAKRSASCSYPESVVTRCPIA